MPPTPRMVLDDTFIAGMPCPICGSDTLGITHAERLPDFVVCSYCHSAFVVEESGDRVMYGRIHEAYPNTMDFALREWVWPEAVARKAEMERLKSPLPTEDLQTPVESTPPPAAEDMETTDDIIEMLEPDRLEPGLREPDVAAEPYEPPPIQEGEADAWASTPETGGHQEPTGEEPTPFPDRQVFDGLGRSLWDGPDLEAPEGSDPYDLSLGVGVPIPTEPDAETPADIPISLKSEPEEHVPTEPPTSPLDEIDLADEALDAPPIPELLSIPEGPVRPRTPPPEHAPETSVKGEALEPQPDPDFRETDPLPGQRYRVVTKGTRVRFPTEACAHCLGAPVRGKLTMSGSLPAGQTIGQRTPTTFSVPLCASCRKRASQRSPEEKTARLFAHMVSALGAMILVVIGLAWVVDIRQLPPLASALILIIMGVLGYTIPAMAQLGRLRPYPPPADAAYVQSTLLVPKDIQGLETAFEWRNEGYAEQFHETNRRNALGKVTPVKDRGLAEP